MPSWNEILHWFTGGAWQDALRAALILAAGLIAARLLATAAARVLGSKLDRHRTMILRRAVFYGVVVLTVASALHQLGFNLSVLLGAAGVASVALGFAAQTSFANLISGLFLMGEGPFTVGEAIKVGETVGTVLSIDLLSVKLRTDDNLLVRIPNETLLKSEVINLSRYPIRRVDLKLGVAYKEDIGRVRETLLALAEANPLVLDEPKALFIVLGFGASSVDLQFSVWAKRENFLTVRNGLYEAIKHRFDAEGIEIPFPHVSVDTASLGGGLPVRVVSDPSVNPPAG